MPQHLDYRTAFELAPIGLVLSRERLMTDCNRQALAIFGATREQLVGQSFELLYPTHDEYERTGQRIVASLDAQRLVCRRPRDEAPAAASRPASCSGAMSPAARSTRGSRMPPASGPSRTCRRGAR